VASCHRTQHSTAVGHTERTTIHIHPRRRHTGLAYEERVTPWRWQLHAETCWGNLMSITKAYNTLEHFFVILHRKIQYIYI
jgi:hypothetical protein